MPDKWSKKQKQEENEEMENILSEDKGKEQTLLNTNQDRAT